jgi:hypothetical protein
MPRPGIVCRVGLLAVLASAAVGATAHAQRVQTIARVIASSGVQGRFADPVCHHGRTLEPAERAAFTYAVLRASRDPDQPMIVDAGGLLTPHGVARYAAEQRPSALAHLVSQLGYRALAFGPSELAAPRDGMLPVMRELRDRGIPMIASNLRCTPQGAELCALLVDASDGPSMHRVANRRMAVLSVIPEGALTQVSPDRAVGVTIESPADTIVRLTRIARAQGADLVMVVVDAGIGDGEGGGVVTLAGSLPADARPDLILVGGGGDVLFARPRTVQPVIVGTPVDDAVEVFIRESDLIREGYEMLAQPLEGRGITVGEPVLDFIDRIGGAYCAAWGHPLAGGGLDEPLDGPGMLRLAASILREAAGADVAVLNREVLDHGWRPAQPGALTESDIYVALEYDEPLQVAEVDSDWLTQLAQRAARGDAMVTPGLTWTGSGSDVKVGGHAVESRAGYRVVTIRFLAAGGDRLLPSLPRGARWVSLPNATLRSVVLDHLRRRREGDARQSVGDPGGTLQWIFRASADLTFSGSSISSPLQRCTAATPPERCVNGLTVNDAGGNVPAYDTSLLNRADTLTFGINIDASADASAPDWTWQNNLSLVYRTAWVETRAGQPFAEAADQIRGRSTLSWRGLRRGRSDQWYLPDPTVDLFLESELNQPDDRTWHWFLVRPSVGVRFQLVDKLQMQLLGGVQLQPFDPAFEVEPGVGATLTLAPWDVLRMGNQFARLGFTFDYFLADLGDSNRSQLRGQLDASFDLAGPLALVLSARLFVQSEQGQDVGIAVDTTAGLRLGYLGRATGP